MITDVLDYDVVIIGSGPAGFQAGLHAIRRKVSVLILGKLHKSSTYRAHIDNFYSVDGKSGLDMLEQARQKVINYGATHLDEDVTDISRENNHFIVSTESGKKINAMSLVLGMGISRNRLGLKNERNLVGKGVSYCVDCDAGFFREQNVAMVGCESAAITGALTLLFYAKKVHLICEKLDASDHIIEKLENSDIMIHEGTQPVEIIGTGAVEGLTLNDGTKLDVTGVFIELGAKGAVELAGNLGVGLEPEQMVYVAANKKQETNIPGIYAAGDICGPPWQVAKAVGEGCIAGLEAASYAKKEKK